MNRHLSTRFALKALLSLLLLGAILNWVGIDAVRDSWALLDFRWVVLAVALFFPTQFLGAFRWYVLLREVNDPQPLASVFRYYLLGQVSALVLPGQISGDFVRTAALAIEGNQAASIALSVVIDKGFLLVVIFACATLGLTTSEPLSHMPAASWVAIAGFVVSAAGVILLCRVRSGRLVQIAVGLFEKLYRLIRRRQFTGMKTDVKVVSYTTIAYCLFLAFCFQVVNSVGAYLLARSFQIDINPTDWLAINAIVSFVQIFPITIGGLGIREGTLAGILSLYTVPNAIATNISLLGFGLVAILLLVGWLISEIIYASFFIRPPSPGISLISRDSDFDE